jgi:hypothetical protein
MVMSSAENPIENRHVLSGLGFGRAKLSAAVCAAFAATIAAMPPTLAHPGDESHAHILHKPYAGIRNNYWYDYRSDIEEAENELRKDLRRAKTSQDRREAWTEYNNELRDARHDYAKEMAEKGYIRPPRVTVGD